MYCANKRSADAAKSAADTAATSLQIDQRAWVGLVKVSFSESTPRISAGNPLDINVQFKNLGKTPAYNVVGHANATILPLTSNMWDHSVNGSRFGLVQPNGDVWTTVSPFLDFHNQPIPLSKEPIDQLKSGKLVVYVVGWMTYEDLFHNPHWVELCYHLLNNLEAFAACDDHNGDDYDKNRK